MLTQSARPQEWKCDHCGNTVPAAYAHKCLEYDAAMTTREDEMVELCERLRRYSGYVEGELSGTTPPGVTDLRVGPRMCVEAMIEAADALTALSSEREILRERVEKLEADNVRLQGLLNNARHASKRRGRDLLREEADAALSAFRTEWEPLRDIADRAGAQSASWLVSRARDLQRRGLVESKWFGNDRTASFKVWRSLGRPVPVHASGPSPLTGVTGG